MAQRLTSKNGLLQADTLETALLFAHGDGHDVPEALIAWAYSPSESTQPTTRDLTPILIRVVNTLGGRKRDVDGMRERLAEVTDYYRTGNDRLLQRLCSLQSELDTLRTRVRPTGYERVVSSLGQLEEPTFETARARREARVRHQKNGPTSWTRVLDEGFLADAAE